MELFLDDLVPGVDVRVADVYWLLGFPVGLHVGGNLRTYGASFFLDDEVGLRWYGYYRVLPALR